MAVVTFSSVSGERQTMKCLTTESIFAYSLKQQREWLKADRHGDRSPISWGEVFQQIFNSSDRINKRQWRMTCRVIRISNGESVIYASPLIKYSNFTRIKSKIYNDARRWLLSLPSSSSSQAVYNASMHLFRLALSSIGKHLECVRQYVHDAVPANKFMRISNCVTLSFVCCQNGGTLNRRRYATGTINDRLHCLWKWILIATSHSFNILDYVCECERTAEIIGVAKASRSATKYRWKWDFITFLQPPSQLWS